MLFRCFDVGMLVELNTTTLSPHSPTPTFLLFVLMLEPSTDLTVFLFCSPPSLCPVCSSPVSTPSEITLPRFTAPCSAASARPDASPISSSVPCTRCPDRPLPQLPATLRRRSPAPASEPASPSSCQLETVLPIVGVYEEKCQSLLIYCWHCVKHYGSPRNHISTLWSIPANVRTCIQYLHFTNRHRFTPQRWLLFKSEQHIKTELHANVINHNTLYKCVSSRLKEALPLVLGVIQCICPHIGTENTCKYTHSLKRHLSSSLIPLKTFLSVVVPEALSLSS